MVGIKKVEGTFYSNQPVQILNLDGKELAKGISSMSSEAIQICVKSPKKPAQSTVVIHRDVLVLSSDLLI